MTSALMVLSAADHWTLIDGTEHPSGFWAEEFVAPYDVFAAAGWEITVATPGGRAPTVDRLSLGITGGLPAKTRRIEARLKQLAPVLSSPADLASVNADDFDVVFYPGGHGPMEDLAADEVSGALITSRLASGKPLALLCHAPAAAFAARNDDGTWPFKGYRMTALSNREELFNRFAHKAKWLLEDRLKEEGARYEAGLPLRPRIVKDRNLYTGQNPASSAALARRLVADLGQPLMSITVSKVIPASPAAVWAMIHDVTRAGEFSPENNGGRWIKSNERFRGKNNIGRFYRWSMAANVTESVPGKVFAFRTDWPSDTSWRYDLEPVDGGTLVTESMEKTGRQFAPVRWIQDAVGVRDRTANLRGGMQITLDRLAEHFARESTR